MVWEKIKQWTFGFFASLLVIFGALYTPVIINNVTGGAQDLFTEGVIVDGLTNEQVDVFVNESHFQFSNSYLNASLEHIDVFLPTELQDDLGYVTPCDPNLMVCQGDEPDPIFGETGLFHILNDPTNEFSDRFFIETDYLFTFETTQYDADGDIPSGFGNTRINQEVRVNYSDSNSGLDQLLNTRVDVGGGKEIQIGVSAYYGNLVLDYTYYVNGAVVGTFQDIYHTPTDKVPVREGDARPILTTEGRHTELYLEYDNTYGPTKNVTVVAIYPQTESVLFQNLGINTSEVSMDYSNVQQILTDGGVNNSLILGDLSGYNVSYYNTTIRENTVEDFSVFVSASGTQTSYLYVLGSAGAMQASYDSTVQAEFTQEGHFRDDVSVNVDEQNLDGFSFTKWDEDTVNITFETQAPTLIREDGELQGIAYDMIIYDNLTNTFTATVDDENLEWYYQAPLYLENGLEEPNATCNATHCGGSYRPENVVGSYAVYHTSKKNNQYETGKAFHVYRPWIEDANGDRVWGTVRYFGERLYVTVPQEFLNNAKYPVRVDPTLGYTTFGGTNYESDDKTVLSNFSTKRVGTIRIYNITVGYDVQANPLDYHFESGIYNSTEDFINSTSTGTYTCSNTRCDIWQTNTFGGNYVEYSDSDYIWIGGWVDERTGSIPITANVKYDSLSGYNMSITSTKTWPSTWYGTSNDGQVLSAYVNYEQLDGNISSCINLEKENGIYNLTQNITGYSGNCFVFDAPDITFDCKGYTLTGTQDGHAFYSGSANNGPGATIKNCVLDNWSYGVFVFGDNLTLLNTTIKNSDSGSFFTVDDNVYSEGNTFIGNGWKSNYNNNLTSINDSFYNTTNAYGWHNGPSNSLVDGAYISNVTRAFKFAYIPSNNIIKNTKTENGCSIFLEHDDSVGPGYQLSNFTLYNNWINCTTHYAEEGGQTDANDSLFNTTKQSGISIAGGSYLGGNFWAKPDGTGFSETCTDLDGDYICDSSYSVNDSIFWLGIDYLPLVQVTENPPTWSDNSTSGTGAGTNITFSVKWTDDVSLSGGTALFYLHNGSNITSQQSGSDQESSTQSFSGEEGGGSSSTVELYSDDFSDGSGVTGTGNCAAYWNIGSTTPSSNTGPQSGDSDDAGSNFVYIETSSGNCDGTPSDGELLIDYEFDWDAQDGENVTFQTNRHGNSDLGTMIVQENSTGSWTQLGSYSQTGNDGNSGTVWTQFGIDASSLTGTGHIRFRSYNHASYTGDAAIDDLNVTYEEAGTSEEQNKTNVTYQDVLSGSYSGITSFNITVYVSSYNDSGSTSFSNTKPELFLSVWDGSEYKEVGNFSLSGTGNSSIEVTDSSILSSWETESNRDIRLQARNLDYYNTSNVDNISWTGVWVEDLITQQEFILVDSLDFTDVVPGTDSQYCYQEQANESTSCGGLSSGSYSNNFDDSNWYDGDNSTLTDGEMSNLYGYVNYTVPIGASPNTTKWEVVYSESGQLYLNYTISQCWADVLQLRIYISGFGSTNAAECWNGTAWVDATPVTTHDGDGGIYEEKMHWDIGDTYLVNDTVAWSNFTAIVNSTTGTTIKWYVVANDSSGFENTTDEFSFTTTSASSCIYGGSGTWNIDCTESCTVGADQNPGVNDVIASGSGTVRVEAPQTHTGDLYVQNQCTLVLDCVGECF